MKTLPTESVHCCVTSPPYWGLRDYGVSGQIGLEESPEEHVKALQEVFEEVRRVLADDGTLWLNYGDAYAGGGRGGHGAVINGHHDPYPRIKMPSVKPKDLLGLPWMLAFALRADGWWLRSDIIWSKPNPMPESVTDRPTRAHEYLFLLSKSARYYYDADAIREPHVRTWEASNGGTFGPVTDQGGKQRALGGTKAHKGDYPLPNPLGRNRRSVWEIPSQPTSDAHFATFPEKLVEPCILAGCPEGGTVLDPFAGSGTVGRVATHLGRRSILIELNADYLTIAARRTAQGGLEV
jgi:DNA modification methylase